MGRTLPCRVISPVMAYLVSISRPVSVEQSDRASVIPAEGPSFGTAPAGTWICMSFLFHSKPASP